MSKDEEIMELANSLVANAYREVFEEMVREAKEAAESITDNSSDLATILEVRVITLLTYGERVLDRIRSLMEASA